MYTAEPDPSDDNKEMWMILDSDGDWVFTVLNEFQAQAAISHLNRG
jgi:hypothetical protein